MGRKRPIEVVGRSCKIVRMKLVRQVVFQLAGAILTVLIWRRFGLFGVVIAIPIAFAIGWYGEAAKHRWQQRR